MKKLLFTLLLAAVTLPGWAEQYPDALYAVGDATSFNWGPNNSPATAPVLYKKSDKVYEGFVNFDTTNGMLKFLVTNAYNQGQWGPATNGHSITSTTVTKEYIEYTSEGWDNSDKKFLFNLELGLYLITANLTEGSESFTFKKWTSSDVYEIGSLAQLKAFADGVNKFDASINAALTADITGMNYAIGWYNSGSDNKLYSGNFNGNGHTVTLSIDDENNSNKGLFGAATGGANIHDVIVAGSVTAKAKAGGIVGTTGGTGTITLTNVINTATIDSKGNTDANAAGLIGCILSNTNVHATNCANTGKISNSGYTSGTQQCAAFAGWTQSGTTFTNCWNIGEINNIEGSAQLYRNSGQSTATNCYDLTNVGNQGTKLDASTLGTGELCYTLNGDQSSINWYQNLTGTVDAYPVPFSSHSQVYLNGEVNCDGKPKAGGTSTYSNSSSSTIPPHSYVNGFCENCGQYQENAITATDGWYEISQPWQLRWMAESVTEHNSTYGSANIKLTANIDYSSYTDQAAMFGKPSNTFKGVFDGQNHTVTVGFNNTTAEETGLFRRINGGTVKNLKVAGTINTNQKLAGGICAGIWQKGIIQNCESAVTITDEGSGDATHGGILACVHDKSNTNNGIQILNCLFSGTLNAPNREGCGGIIGWPDNAVNEVKVHNCLVTGTITLLDDDDNDLIVRNTADVKNCYYSSTLTNNLRNSKNASQIVSDEIANGVLCFKLNEQVSGAENWYQNLPGSVDVLPTPFYTSGKVYANGNFQCDGITPKPGSETTYSNTEGAIIDEHSFANHLCSVCKAVGQEPSTTDGVYQIEDIGHLIWFAAHVNEGSATASGKLTADITQNDAVYTPIGSSTNPYHGTFDGDYHTVTLNLTDENKDNQGIFGVLTGGATINNLIAAGTVKGYSGVAGIAGSTNGGGNVTFNCCGNEAAVTASHANAGGILGVDMASAATITMKNVYSTGAIGGGTDNGGLSGWAGNAPHIINAYCISEVSGNSSSQFIRNNDGTVNFKNTFGSDQITGTMLTDGTLCAKLGFAFRQNIGSGHPCFDQAQGFVAQIGEAGYSTMYNVYSDAEIPTGVEAYAGVVNGESLSLVAITGAIAASEPVILKLKEGTDAGLFNFMPTSGISKAASNNLKGSDGNVDGGANIYALAKLTPEGETEPVVGFYPTGNYKIPEGKAYLTGPGEVKGFTFVFDDDATAIEMVNGQWSMDNDQPIFNLAGQRIQKMQKGINIVNGKKILF